MVGINSNLIAGSATRNLGAANSVVASSVARLSSGNRIIKASDDVAGLAIGTALSSTVKTLEIALLNTQQANSVLSIADGALAQIGDILTRQNSLASQANSGSLGLTERGFLNQEFQALVAEIDRIVSATQFNGITLLDGTVAGGASVSVSGPLDAGILAPATVNVAATPSAYSAVGTIASSGIVIAANWSVGLSGFADPTNAQVGLGTFTRVPGSFHENSAGAGSPEDVSLQTIINGQTYLATLTASANGGNLATGTFTFTSTSSASAFTLTLATAPLATALNSTATVDSFATNLTTAFAGVSAYQTRTVSGLNTTSLTGSPLAGITGATAVSITSAAGTGGFNTTTNTFGTVGAFTVVAGSDTANYISVVINGTTYSASDLGGADNSIAAAEDITLFGRDGAGNATSQRLVIDLAGLTGPIDISDAGIAAELENTLNQYFNVGGAGSAYVTVGDVTSGNTVVNSVSSLASFNDATFQGSFGAFTVANFSENTAETATLSTTLGDKTYTALLTATGSGGNIAAQELTFTATDSSGSAFTLDLQAVTAAINTATTAGTYAADLTSALAGVNIYQVRTVQNLNVTSIANTVAEGLGANSITIRSNGFDTTASTFGDASAFTGVAGIGALNSLSIQVNGVTFSATDVGGADDVLSSADTSIVLIGRDAAGADNNQRITIDLSALTGSIDLTNQDEVDALTSALTAYVGAGSSSGGLSFQVGANVTDSISVAISSALTTTIYADDSGDVQVLDITTQSNAQQAIEVVGNAISTIIGRRADVGAAISRFNFAASNLEVSISNQDAARGSFLDADIATESTNFATAQVKLQASIAVLAQANALPRNLLTLLQ
jgi:flagellin